MQRIFASPWTPEEYVTTEAYRQIIPESMCPSCLRAVRLHRHARYQRWLVTLMAKLLLLWIARFFCPLCKTTISYLPDFAFTYRPLQPQTFQAFLDGQVDRADVRSFAEALWRYQRRAEAFATELIRTVGVGLLGRPPPRSLRGFWPWLKKASEGLRPLTRRLVTDFKINLFARYQCHQPAGP
jgi:hypothetical protein